MFPLVVYGPISPAADPPVEGEPVPELLDELVLLAPPLVALLVLLLEL
jgi:hypothetical protein